MKKQADEGRKAARTVVTVSYALAVDDGLPLEQVALVDRAQALDARLVLLLDAPSVELLEEALGGGL